MKYQLLPLLDGQPVEESIIDPAKHRFLGTFRPPVPPRDITTCPCGVSLITYYGPDLHFQHWQLGHLDVPQYQTISPGIC